MAKITNVDKFSNMSWWIASSPMCKSTVFTRPLFHLSVWMYIAFGNAAYFMAYFDFKLGTTTVSEVIQKQYRTNSLENVNSVVLRLLTWILAAFVGQVTNAYYTYVRAKASTMIEGMSAFVDGISISVDYKHPRSTAFLNDLHGSVRSLSYYALALASTNTRFKLTKTELRALFDDNGYDGEFMLSHPKKQTITVMRLALLRSLEEEKEASDSCFKKESYNNFREENIRQSVTQFAGGAMSTISCVSSNKLPFAYVHLIIWSTRTFLLLHIFLAYVSFAIEHMGRIEEGAKPALSCYNSAFFFDGVDSTCHTEEFIFFNIVNIVSVYFLLGLLELYPTLIKTWQSQLVLQNYKRVLDSICEPLKPDVYKQPKNLSQLKKKKEKVASEYERDDGYDVDGDVNIDFDL